MDPNSQITPHLDISCRMAIVKQSFQAESHNFCYMLVFPFPIVMPIYPLSCTSLTVFFSLVFIPASYTSEITGIYIT